MLVCGCMGMIYAYVGIVDWINYGMVYCLAYCDVVMVIGKRGLVWDDLWFGLYGMACVWM